MATSIPSLRSSTWTPDAKKYGITEAKKAELDELAIQVTAAQYIVNNEQSIVNSLTQKASNFQAFLAVADTNRTTTYNNKVLLNQLIQSAKNLKNTSSGADEKMVKANDDTKVLGSCVEQVINKLIYSADVINALSNLIIRKKAANPLISDELITLVATAGADANNAVALTLVALQSTFAAEASNLESVATASLTNKQCLNLYDTLIGKVKQAGTGTDAKKTNNSLMSLINVAYTNAVAEYNRMQSALKRVTLQLNDANADLARAQTNLQSLQLGLAAATAAAFA